MGLLSGKKETEFDDQRNVIQQIPLDQIVSDQSQPRKHSTGIEQLAESIKTTGGIHNPLHVLKIAPDKYQIITGERRYRAAQSLCKEEQWKMLGESVPCIVHQKEDLDETTILRLQLIENLQREDLSPLDEARAYKRLMDQGLTQRKIANELGRSEALISGSLAIVTLPEDVLALLEALEPPVSKRELIKIAQEKDEQKKELLLKLLLGKGQEDVQEEKAPAVEEGETITGDQIWEWLKKLIRKDKDVLLKFISPAKIRKLKEAVEGTAQTDKVEKENINDGATS